MRLKHSLAYVLCLTSYVLLAGEAYTNLAGNAIAAIPVKIDGDKVTFVREGRRKSEEVRSGGVTIPLRAFPPSEQQRIVDAIDLREGRAPSRPIPGELKGLAAEIAAQRERVRARTKAGRMTEAALAEYCANLAGSWAHAVETANLNEEEKSYWKGRCP